MKTTIELYGAPTGNCVRAAIALEVAGIKYAVRHVDLTRGGQRASGYLAINPAGKVPALVETTDNQRFVLTQSNAIILYADGKAPGRLAQGVVGVKVQLKRARAALPATPYFCFTTSGLPFSTR